MSFYIASASHICNVCSSNRQMLGKVHTIRREGDWCILIENRNKMILDTIHAPKLFLLKVCLWSFTFLSFLPVFEDSPAKLMPASKMIEV